MSALWAMTWNGFREARRNRVTVVVFGFAIVMLFSSTLLANVTVWTFDRVLTDFGLGLMSLLLVGLSVFLSCGLLPKEIERRTIFLIVSRPVSRSKFLIARLGGNMLTLLVLMVSMTAVMAVQLVLLKAPLSQPLFASLGGLLVELLVLTAAGFFFSAFSSQLVSALCTVGLYFAGHFSIEIWRLADNSDSTGLRLFAKAIYWVVPNLERLNFRYFASYAIPVPAEMQLQAALYGAAYALIFVVLGCLIFERRDFK